MGAKTSASSLDSKLKKLVRKLKQEGNWPPTTKRTGSLGGLNYLRDQLKVGFPQIKASVKRLGYGDVFIKGSQTPAQAIAKEKLKNLVATGDYPTDLDEIGKIVGIDTNQSDVNRRASARQLLGMWMNELGASRSSKWDTANWSQEQWKFWEEDQLKELRGEKKLGTGSRTYKGTVSFSEMFAQADKFDQERYLYAVKTHDYVGDRKKTEWYKARNNIYQRYRRLQKSLLAEAKGKKGLEAVIDGLTPEQIEKVIERRGRRNFQSFKSRADIYSWETIDGTEKGKVKQGTKKIVGTLLVATPDELVKMERLAIQMVRDQLDTFHRTGTMPKVNHLDHIFPMGSPRIINGKVYGQGAVDKLGKFQGYGLSTIQNIRGLAAHDNMSGHNVLSSERVDELLNRERLSGEAGKNIVSVDESMRQSASLSESELRSRSEKALKGHLKGKRVPRFWGGTALSVPLMMGAAALSEKSWGAGLEAAKSPWLYADAFTGIDTKRTVENPSRLFSPQTVIYQDIIEPTAGLIAQGLRSRDPTEDEYAEAASMGSPQGLLGEGHPGFQDRLRKWY